METLFLSRFPFCPAALKDDLFMITRMICYFFRVYEVIFRYMNIVMKLSRVVMF